MYGPDPIPELKRALAAELVRVIKGWNAHDIGVLIGTDQPRISDLRRGKLDRFSLESIVRFLARMRHRVEFCVVDSSAESRRLRLKARRPGCP
jgi:predicted XRE-type DNA-binding protein